MSFNIGNKMPTIVLNKYATNASKKYTISRQDSATTLELVVEFSSIYVLLTYLIFDLGVFV